MCRRTVQQAEASRAEKSAAQLEADKNSWRQRCRSGTHNQPAGLLRFSLHQRAAKNFTAKTCEGNVLLVEVTQAFSEKHTNAVFVLRESGFRMGKVLSA